MHYKVQYTSIEAAQGPMLTQYTNPIALLVAASSVA